jgi:catechol 2,3-dioxygenase-like lactoylglutathione lyase family enzyme
MAREFVYGGSIGMITRVNHAQITIPRGAEAEAKARAFYCELLGLREIEKPESLRRHGGFWLQVGELQVHVGIEDGFDRSLTKAHLAYEVDDLDKLRSTLEQHGFASLDSVPIPGYERFEIRDPFANRVEFISRVR